MCICTPGMIYFIAHTQDVIVKWEEFVHDHEHYDTSYNTCTRWLTDLRKRLAHCTDISADIEERQNKIQVSPKSPQLWVAGSRKICNDWDILLDNITRIWTKKSHILFIFYELDSTFLYILF